MGTNDQDGRPWAHKFFIHKRTEVSQAGRRGFDPRLPLHLFKHLGRSHFLRFNAINALSSRSPRGARLEGVPAPSNQFQNHSRSLHLKEPHNSAPRAVIEQRLSPICEPPRASVRRSRPRIRFRSRPLCCPFALNAYEHQRRLSLPT
jgi:hypothetical protein